MFLIKKVKVLLTLTKKKFGVLLMNLTSIWPLSNRNSDQNLNQINNQKQDENIIEVPVFDLIYNTVKYNQDFLEDKHANNYHVYIFAKYKNIDRCTFNKFENIQLDLDKIDQNKNLEIKLNPQAKNHNDGGLILFIRQLNKNNVDYLKSMANNKYVDFRNGYYGGLEKGFGFTRLDGKFEDGKLQQLKYINSQNEEYCIVNMNFKINKNTYKELWQMLLLNRDYLIESNKLHDKTFKGTKFEFTIDNKCLLDKDQSIYFDPGYILIKLQEYGQQIINNFEDKKITVVCFVKSISLKDNQWHFDFEKVTDILDDNFGGYKSTHDINGVTTPITTNGLKIFVLSGDFSKKFKENNFDLLDNTSKIQLLRDHGFAELELHEIKYRDNLTNKTDKIVRKKALFIADFLEKNDISESLVYQFKESSNSELVPVESYTIEEKTEKWKKLKERSIIAHLKPKIIYVATVNIDKKSLFCFFNQNLNGDYSLESKKIPNCNIEINGKENKAQEKKFINDCIDSKVAEIPIESRESIYSLRLKFDTKNNDSDMDFFEDERYVIKNEDAKKSDSIELILKKDGNKGVALFYKNKKTDIQVEISESNKHEGKFEFVEKRDADGKFKLFARNRNKWEVDRLLSENVVIENMNMKSILTKEHSNKKNVNQNKQGFGNQSINDRITIAKNQIQKSNNPMLENNFTNHKSQ